MVYGYVNSFRSLANEVLREIQMEPLYNDITYEISMLPQPLLDEMQKHWYDFKGGDIFDKYINFWTRQVLSHAIQDGEFMIKENYWRLVVDLARPFMSGPDSLQKIMDEMERANPHQFHNCTDWKKEISNRFGKNIEDSFE